MFIRPKVSGRTEPALARAWRPCLPLALLVAVLIGNFYFADRAAAQIPGAMQPVPTVNYLSTYGLYYQGEYDNALRDYLNEGRTAIKTVESNWIDSICYHAMAGECYFPDGPVGQGASSFRFGVATVRGLFGLDDSGHVHADDQSCRRGTNRGLPLGSKHARRAVGSISRCFVDRARTRQQHWRRDGGGAIQQAQLFPIRPIEIVKATALAIRRRHDMLGPLGEHDTLTKDVVASLTRRPTQPNHWSEAWIDVQLGSLFPPRISPTRRSPFSSERSWQPANSITR